jgi:MFS family permease
LPDRDPEHDFTLRQSMRTRAFWALGIGHAAALLVVSAVVVHLIPHLTEAAGMTLPAAASVVASLTVVTAIGQLLGGLLGDRFDKRRLAMGAMIAHGAALLALAWLEPTLGTGVFVVLHGLAWGVRGPLMGSMRADYFGATHFGSIMGASTLIFMVGQLLGPVIAGAMADAFGDYRLGFSVLAGLALTGSLAFRLATPPARPRPRPSPPAALP